MTEKYKELFDKIRFSKSTDDLCERICNSYDGNDIIRAHTEKKITDPEYDALFGFAQIVLIRLQNE